MKFISIVLLCTAVTLASSCNQNAENLKTTEVSSEAKFEPGFVKETEEEYQTDTTGTPQQDQKQKQQQIQQPVQKDWDRKIVKTAVITAEVKDYSKFYATIRAGIENLGGYIAQEDQSQSDFKIENRLVIKVPVDQFSAVVQQISSNTQKIEEKRVSSQDVTTEVVDTKSRLEAKRNVRNRYLELLRQAKNMEEILKVQNEINGMQEEIESAEGRINYLGHATVFSTVELTYYQVLNASAKNAVEPSFGSRLLLAVKTGGNWFAELFIALLSIWPLFLVFGLLVLFVKRYKARKAIAIPNTGAKAGSEL